MVLRFGLLAAALCSLAALQPAQAQQLVYQPRNPAFGGLSLNYQWQLQSAQAQNDFEAQRAPNFARDPLQDFEQSLQRQILSQLARELTLNRFRSLDLNQQGRFDFGEFTIEIVPGLNEISIRIFNLLTGAESVVTIPSFP